MVIDIRDIRFTLDDDTVFHQGIQGDDLFCGRYDMTLDVQDLSNRLDGFQEASSLLGHRRQDQIPQVMSADIHGIPVRIFKAVIHQFLHQGFIFRKRDHDVPDISHGRNMKTSAQASCTASVIRHCHNSGNIDIFQILDSPADRGLSVSASDYNDLLHTHHP